MKLQVPYYSQHEDIADPYWQPRACGITCVKMTLDYFGAETPALVEMARTGEQEGGYGPSGWVHDYEVGLFGRYGFSAHREEKILPESGVLKIYESLLEGNPVIVSVLRNRGGEKPEFHQVLVVGFEEGCAGKIEGFFYHDERGASDVGIIKTSVTGFYYHDPARRDRGGEPYRFVKIPEFLEEWRKMAIFAKRGSELKNTLEKQG